jgi:hypothetical protein
MCLASQFGQGVNQFGKPNETQIHDARCISAEIPKAKIIVVPSSNSFFLL